ncbi:MAG TPA: DUF5996 family protein [Gemmatimonadales bacterium]|nr:DUF5996 family protein [Gemmatimonadales bacterium]
MATTSKADRPGVDRGATSDVWPSLPLERWQDTYDTLHMWAQIVGKTCLAFAPPENHWWHIAFRVTARGLTTSALTAGPVTFDIAFDFVDHQLAVRPSAGRPRLIPLVAQPVADFYHQYLAVLAELGVDARIRPVPVEVVRAIPFAEDREHKAYDPREVERLRQILVQADRVLRRFRGRFLGKSSPVHFFWGGFDLACTRFSGRTAPPHPGGVPNCPDYVMLEGYSHECASAGFWPGGGAVTEPAFYAYHYPQAPGYERAPVPAPAFYHEGLREFILPYEAWRRTEQPEAVLLEFLERTYGAAADLATWDRKALERPSRPWDERPGGGGRAHPLAPA